LIEKQLQNFSYVLKKTTKIKSHPIPLNWQEAFEQLSHYINNIRHKKKKVIFFDELPWLDSMHSGFLKAFDYFWNSYCTKRNDLIIVICGSAASWMINKIVHNKGGLHNRITKQIRLLPFTLAETQKFFKLKNIKLDQYQIVQLYMAIGGVPLYLNEVQRGKSAIQSIDKICFAKDSLLRDEFDKLYHSLFNNAQVHIAIIRALASKRIGLTRNEIVRIAKLQSGGYFSGVLNELEESGFIASYTPLDKKTKDTIFRLNDEYSLFYLKFIEKSKSYQSGTWTSIMNSRAYISWSGYAFESVCLKHITNIKKALGIAGVYSENSAWYGKKEGAQIDLLIDRADKCINSCELKFSSIPFEVTKKYANELQHKLMAYKISSKTHKTIFTTLVTTYGLKQNEYSAQYIDSVVLLKDLF
jgi:hypothetical protein